MKRLIKRSLFTWITCLLIAQRSTAQATSWVKQYNLVRPSDGVFIVSKAGKMAVADQHGLLLTKLPDQLVNHSCSALNWPYIQAAHYRHSALRYLFIIANLHFVLAGRYYFYY